LDGGGWLLPGGVGNVSAGGIKPEKRIIFVLLLTGVFAAVFGISGLTLSKLQVRPTTLAFMNTTYKLVTTVVSHFIFPVFVPFMSWCGYALAFMGFLIYTLLKPAGVGHIPNTGVHVTQTDLKKDA